MSAVDSTLDSPGVFSEMGALFRNRFGSEAMSDVSMLRDGRHRPRCPPPALLLRLGQIFMAMITD